MATQAFPAPPVAGPYLINPQAKSAAERYWNMVHQVANELIARNPGADGVHITSLEDPFRGFIGGRVFRVPFFHAAMRIVDKQYRVSTPEEIVGEDKRLKAEDERCMRETERQRVKFEPSDKAMTQQADLIGLVLGRVMEQLTDVLRPLGDAKKESSSPRSRPADKAEPPQQL